MGWKSTIKMSREDAIAALIYEHSKIHAMSNQEIEDLMDGIFGDDIAKPYYGHNFWVVDKVEDEI